MADGATPCTRIDPRVRLDARGATRTEEGFLRVPVRIAKPGVLSYNEGGRVVRELVPPETLADPDWLASMEGKPLTLHHPDTAVTPDNIRDLQIGTLLPPVRFEDGYVVGDALITDRDGIDAVNAGTIEVSPGYNVSLDPTPGTHPEYGPYDRIQSRRYAGNHLALTDRARGGRDIRLLLRADAVASDPLPENPMPATSPLLLPILAALMLDPAMYADDAAAAAAIGTKLAEMKATAAGVAEATETMAGMDEMVAEVAEAGPIGADACSPKMDSARRDARAKNHTALHGKLLTLARDRARADAAAASLGMPAEETGKMGMRALRRAIVLKAKPTLRADAAPAVYDAAYEMIMADEGVTARRDAASAVTGAADLDAATRANLAADRKDAVAEIPLTPSAASARAMGFATYQPASSAR